MSYDLVFWRDLRNQRPDLSGIYTALLNGKTVGGIEPLDAEAILTALDSTFPGIERGPQASASWVDDDATRAFEFSWSSKHFSASAKGAIKDAEMNAVIDACVDAGARLYDPQVNERFD